MRLRTKGTIALLALLSVAAATIRVSDLPSLTTPSTDDVIMIVDDPAGTSSSRKITWANLMAAISISGSQIASGTVSDSRLSSTVSKLGPSIDETEMALSDITTLNANTLRHGFLPKLDGDSTHFLNGQGNLVTPPGGGDVVGPASATDNFFPRFDTASGKLLQSSLLSMSDAGTLSGSGWTVNLLGDAIFRTAQLTASSAYNAADWNGSLEVPTKDAIRDKIESMGGGGGGTLANTVLNSGASAAYLLPSYADSTGTNITPTVVSVDTDGDLSGVKSIAFGQSIPNVVSLGTIGAGGTATLTGTNSNFSATFSGATATIALPAATGSGLWYLHGLSTYAGGEQIITIPSLIRPEMDFDSPITKVTNSATSGGRFTMMFKVLSGTFVEVSVIGDAYSPSGGGAGSGDVVSGNTLTNQQPILGVGSKTVISTNDYGFQAAIGIRPVLNIMDFGATPGTGDNTAAFQAACDAVDSRIGGIVEWPAGKWYAGPVYLRRNGIVLRGQGAVHEETSGGWTNYVGAYNPLLPVFIVGDNTNHAYGCQIQDVTLYGGDSSPVNDFGLVVTSGARRLDAENVAIWRFTTNLVVKAGWVPGTGLECTLNSFNHLTIRGPSSEPNSRGVYVAMPDSNTGSYYTTFTIFDDLHIQWGQNDSTNSWAMEVSDTDVDVGRTYIDCWQYRNGLLTTSPAGSSGQPRVRGVELRIDSAGGGTTQPAIWTSDTTSKQLGNTIDVVELQLGGPIWYGAGGAGNSYDMGTLTTPVIGKYAQAPELEVQDAVYLTRPGRSDYSRINTPMTNVSWKILSTDQVIFENDDADGFNFKTAGTVKENGVEVAKVGGNIGAATATTPSLSANSTEVVTAAWVRGANFYDERWIPASAMLPTATSGPSLRTNTWATTTDGQVLEVLDFDGSTAETAQFGLTLPDSWGAGTLKAKFVWKAVVATSGTAAWTIGGGSYADGEVGGNTLGTVVTVTDGAQATTNTVAVTAATSAITIGGSPSAGHQLWFKVGRDPTNGSDDIASDCSLIGVQLQYYRALGGAAW